ncbi:MAG: hypothetical protein K6G56_01430 [Clostridiales bacterium]|nr:hypothetical protein [Clostridiales bacterium]
MENNESKKRKGVLSLTFCAIMAALGVGIILVGGLIGVATYAAPLIASMCLIPVIYEFGSGRAWLAWLATALLAALLSADKEAAAFYVFLGYYPIIRPVFNRIRPRALRLLVKFLYFAAVILAMYALLCFVVKLDAVLYEIYSEAAWVNVLLFFALVAVMLLYDAAVRAAEVVYLKRIRDKLRFLG